MSTGTARMASSLWSWREVCSAQPRGLWERWPWAKCPIQMPTETQRSVSPKMHPGKTKGLERPDSSTPISHFARYLMEAALCFSIGDHAGINCQTCLTPPCHLIIACNTPECWQSWAIDSWHSLKLLIIFSQSPFQTCQLLCIVYEGEKSSILRFQDYALRGKLAVTLVSVLECLCIPHTDHWRGFRTVEYSCRMTVLMPASNRNK